MSENPIRTVGRYEVSEVVGRGGAAVVYLAVQRDLRRQVALKELAPVVGSSDSSFAERFSQESRVAGSLSHPNVVTVYEFLEVDGVPYIAMEYLSRGSLRQYVGGLTLAQVVGVLEGVLAGLAHGESRSVVHRDLKPENLLVTADGRVKIADFGVARAYVDAVTMPVVTVVGTMIGTPSYMAPEQVLGGEVGAAADLYSLGIVAWELLAGRVPFEERGVPVAVLYRHVHEPVPPVGSVAGDVDPRIEAWLERMLAKDPADRFPSAEAAWEELEDVVLALLGPRWRRDARLPVVDAEVAGRPLTPALFDDGTARPIEPTLDAVTPTDPALIAASVPAAGEPRSDDRPGGGHDPEEPGAPKRRIRRTPAIIAVVGVITAAVIAGLLLGSGGGSGKPARTTPSTSTPSTAGAEHAPPEVVANQHVLSSFVPALDRGVARLQSASTLAQDRSAATEVGSAYATGNQQLKKEGTALGDSKTMGLATFGNMGALEEDYTILTSMLRTNDLIGAQIAKPALVRVMKKFDAELGSLDASMGTRTNAG